MPDSAYYLDQLAPLEALILLSETAESDTASLDRFPHFYLEPSQSVFGHTATLIIPASQQNPPAGIRLLIEAYRNLKGEDPGHMVLRKTGLPLSRGLAWLLLHSETDEDHAALPMIPEEFLLLGNLSAEEAARTLEDIRFHATHCRIAASAQTYLFHVLDDDQRGSSFQAALAGDHFSNLSQAQGYEVGKHKLFLPPTIRLAQRALDKFVYLLQRIPALLDRQQVNEKGPIAAITNGIPGQTIEESSQSLFRIYYLGNLHFQGQATFQPAKSKDIAFRVQNLENSQEALDQLQKALHQQSHDVGYQIQLRPMRQPDAAVVARMRLLEQQTEINTRLAYLDSVSKPRPILLRFAQNQLETMAKLLRAFPLEVLRKGYPLYAFQATKANGQDHLQGHHYLYLQPQDAVMSELDPLLPLGDGPLGPDRFWLDPLWARYYHEESRNTLVFVPQDKALFPAMHGWSAQQMDGYLREVMHEWFSHQELDPLPHEPIYLFEGDSDISISVLNRENFKPLHTRLSWINDHLQINQEVGIDDFIKILAKDISRQQLANDAGKRASEADSQLDELLHQVNRQTARKLSEFTEVVNGEFNKVLQQTDATAQYLRQAFDYLTELTKLGKEAQGMAHHGFQTLVKSEGRYRDLTRFIERLETDIDRELHKAERQRGDMVKKITRGINELTTTHEELREKLEDLLRFRK